MRRLCRQNFLDSSQNHCIRGFWSLWRKCIHVHGIREECQEQSYCSCANWGIKPDHNTWKRERLATTFTFFVYLALLSSVYLPLLSPISSPYSKTVGITWGVSLKRTPHCCQVHDRTAKVPSVVSDLQQHGSEKAWKQALPSKSEYLFFPASHTFAQLLSRPSQAPGMLELPLSRPWAWDRCSGLQNVTGLSSGGSKHEMHVCPSCPVSCA